MARCCGCGPRCLLFAICCLQLISSIERQVFDFLGQMWAPILFNFVSTIVTLIGLFGVYYHRVPHLSMFAVWQLIAIGWNAFVAAFYMELGELSRETDYLNLGTGSKSWWAANGPNCVPHYNLTDWSAFNSHDPARPSSVEGCLLPFYAIEVGQASVHFVLSALGLILTMVMLCRRSKDDDSSTLRRDMSASAAASLQGHYSITYHPRPNSISNTLPRNGHHRRSTNSLPQNGRRSMKRNPNRSSARSTSSGRRKKRRRPQQVYDTNSIYQSQSQLVHNQFDVSSLDSFSPGGGPHNNPLYSGSIASAGSRFSLYTINPAATLERICVDNNNRRRQRSPIYMNASETTM